MGVSLDGHLGQLGWRGIEAFSERESSQERGRGSGVQCSQSWHFSVWHSIVFLPAPISSPLDSNPEKDYEIRRGAIDLGATIGPRIYSLLSPLASSHRLPIRPSNLLLHLPLSSPLLLWGVIGVLPSGID